MEATTFLKRCSIAVCMSALIFICNCGKETVVIGSSFDRYDHNRSKTVCIISKPGDTLFTGMISDGCYSPHGSKSFPRVVFKNDSLGKDALPSAVIVPLFNGIELPLQTASAGNRQSDKSDLIDFLSTGPLAQAGVSIPDMSGDAKATEVAYTSALDFLSSINNLEGNRTTVISRLKSSALKIADEVIESRFRQRAFADILAFKQGDFWFVMYKPPTLNYYSRLVVVAATSKRPSRTEEKP
jgi:hypothetical protein